MQVVYIVLQGMDCQFHSSGTVGLLWLQTLISLSAVVYVCIPGLRMITKILYLHLLPSFILFLLSSYISYVFLQEESECRVYGHDMRPLVNAMFFAQGVVPVVSILILSNDLRKVCYTKSKKGYKERLYSESDEE